MVPVDRMRSFRSRGTTLIELLVGLVIIAVALAALATTLPLLTSLVATEDAEVFAREGRGCGEVLLAVHDAGGLDLSGCPATNVAAGDWADDAEAANALNAACGVATLELSCNAPGGADYDVVEIGWSRGGMSSMNLQFPRDGDSE